MNHLDVAIVGAGPTGLALACELRLAGVSCRVFERRKDDPNITRAFAVHARTLELLDARGLADRLVERGLVVPSVQPTPKTVLDLSKIDSRYPMLLIVAQSGTERVLADRARELGAEVVSGAEVVGLAQDGDEVRLDLDGPGGRYSVRASYVVGADGAHSTVRRLLGVDFVGRQYETHILLADVQVDRPPSDLLLGTANVGGLVLLVPYGDGWFRAIAWDRTRDRVPLGEPVTADEVRDAFRRIAGDDFGIGEPRWRTRFLSERRQARHYRVGRVFLAGDAAHVHSPLGGQGMNTGIQDAFNLGWKLAAAVHGWAPPGLLDSYHRERHQVGARVLALTDGFNRLALSSTRLGLWARQTAIRTLVRVPPVRRRVVGRITGVGIGYDRPRGAHPCAGRRLPDFGDAREAYRALRTGRFVLVTRAAAGLAAGLEDDTGWSERLVSVDLAPAEGAPAVLLLRPDGYVAWASDRADRDEVRQALRHWLGPVRAGQR
ncbi:FAD-dependent monooxygenase [Actinoplanes sp. NPDC051513]|uniref:FAD-dependent monooxygenase n=1 Tax=Actinoplanes sp. NPDC051513 TaxID=3363908 RepID=UPI0037B80906